MSVVESAQAVVAGWAVDGLLIYSSVYDDGSVSAPH